MGRRDGSAAMMTERIGHGAASALAVWHDAYEPMGGPLSWRTMPRSVAVGVRRLFSRTFPAALSCAGCVGFYTLNLSSAHSTRTTYGGTASVQGGADSSFEPAHQAVTITSFCSLIRIPRIVSEIR